MPAEPIDFARLSAELVRALRGRRSQSALSRRAGCRSNILHRWERGSSWPTAARFLAVSALCGVEPRSCYVRFFRRAPGWLALHGAATPEAVAAFLRDLRGRTPIVDVSAACGINRYTLSRWFKGTAQPKLPEFLHVVEALSRRVLDFVATLVDPAELPCVANAWSRVEAARSAAYDEPWSHAVLRALELEAYRSGGFCDARWLATKLGAAEERVEQALLVLQKAGQVKKRAGRFAATGVQRVDTRSDPVRARQLKAAWFNVALDRCRAGAPGSYGFSLFAVSRAELVRLRDLQLDYVRAMQAIIAQSTQGECVALYCAQLLDLDASADNALVEAEG